MCFPSSDTFYYGQIYSGTGQDCDQDVSVDEIIHGNIND